MISLIDPDFIAGTTLDGFQITAPSGYWAKYHLHRNPPGGEAHDVAPDRGRYLEMRGALHRLSRGRGRVPPVHLRHLHERGYAGESHLKSIEINARSPTTSTHPALILAGGRRARTRAASSASKPAPAGS